MKKSKRALFGATVMCLAASALGALVGCENLPAPAEHVHNWGEWEITTPATCTADGVKTRVCADDSAHTQTEKVDKLDHDYSDEWTVDAAATCEEDGTKSHHCNDCDAKTDVTVIAANDHAWGDWVVTKDATCTEAGVKTKTCANDQKHTQTEEIPVAAHTLTAHNAVAATCTENGVAAYWECTVCHNMYADEDCTVKIDAPVAVDAADHAWGDWVVTKDATCTEAGVKTKTCANDQKHTQTEEIPVAAHTLTAHKAVAATCTEDGVEAYWECTVCHNMYADEDCAVKIDAPVTVAATGHTYGEWVVTTPATCEEDGVQTKSCECGDTQTQPIAATGHTYGEWVVTTPATCEEDGVQTKSCECGDTQTQPIAATGHAYGEWVKEVYTSCGEEYTMIKTCVNDHEHVERQTLSGHYVSADVVTGDVFTCPLCEKDFIYVYKENDSSDITALSADDYYFEYVGNTVSSAGFNSYMKLELSAGKYEIDFEHLNGLNGAIAIVTLHNGTSDTTGTRVVSGSRTGGAVQTSFADVATIEHTSNKLQTLKFTFDASAHAGKFIKITLVTQYAAKFDMSVKFEKNNKLVYGDNTVNISETYAWVDEYKFVSATEKTYSITVPAGVSVAVANKELDPNDFNYLTTILDSSSFMEGEECYVDFTVKANETVYLVFNSAEKGNIAVTIGDEIGEKIPPILVLNEPFSVNFADKEVVNTLTVAEDVPEGEYLITLKYYSVAAGRNYFYFTINGEDKQTLGAGTSINLGNYKDFAVIVTLKAGDVLVFTTSGGTSTGLIDVTMTEAPAE